MKAKLILENGNEFIGDFIGENLNVIRKLVFNTDVVGYQEVLTDSANKMRFVLFTYPLIGNYGFTNEDDESKYFASGVICGAINNNPSNFRYTKTLIDKVYEHNSFILTNLDTREITNNLRKFGDLYAIVCDLEKSKDEALKEIAQYKKNEVIDNVSVKRIMYSKTKKPVLNVALLDLGYTQSLINMLNNLNINVTILPQNYDFKEIDNLHVDALIITNGIYNNGLINEVKNNLKSVVKKLPIYGIGLGALILAAYYGNEIIPLKNAHLSTNHPVLNLRTKKIDYYRQNHDYQISQDNNLEITHINQIDNTIEGFCNKEDKVLATLFYMNDLSDFLSLVKEDSNNA